MGETSYKIELVWIGRQTIERKKWIIPGELTWENVLTKMVEMKLLENRQYRIHGNAVVIWDQTQKIGKSGLAPELAHQFWITPEQWSPEGYRTYIINDQHVIRVKKTDTWRELLDAHPECIKWADKDEDREAFAPVGSSFWHDPYRDVKILLEWEIPHLNELDMYLQIEQAEGAWDGARIRIYEQYPPVDDFMDKVCLYGCPAADEVTGSVPECMLIRDEAPEEFIDAHTCGMVK